MKDDLCKEHITATQGRSCCPTATPPPPTNNTGSHPITPHENISTEIRHSRNNKMYGVLQIPFPLSPPFKSIYKIDWWQAIIANI